MEQIERYNKRSVQLESLGATYHKEEKGFVCNDCFFDDSDVLTGDEADFEETIDLVKMAVYRSGKVS